MAQIFKYIYIFIYVVCFLDLTTMDPTIAYMKRNYPHSASVFDKRNDLLSCGIKTIVEPNARILTLVGGAHGPGVLKRVVNPQWKCERAVKIASDGFVHLY